MYEVNAIYARVVLRHCQRLGVPLAELFEGTELDTGFVQVASSIELWSFVHFLENAQRLTGDASLGLLIGSSNTVSALGYMGLAISAAPTIREGVQALEHYSRLQASYIQVDLASNLQTMSIRIHFLVDVGDIERLHTEASVMLLQDYVEMVTGEQLTDAHYRMGFPLPEYAHRYPDFIHSEMSFGWSETTIELPLHWLDRRSPYFSAELWQQAQFELAQQLRVLGKGEQETFTRHVRALLLSYEPPLPNLKRVASRLHISDRTLNRRLQREGIGFRELRAGIQHEWACRYLVETDFSIDAIASILGYQEPANFRRAFKAREACAPLRYRQLHA